jgi:hypothetical protein
MVFLYPEVEAAGVVLEKHISVKAAAQFSGYNIKYLRRLLRHDGLEGIKIGQVWLIRMASLEETLRNGQMIRDRRRGPRAVMVETRDAAYLFENNTQFIADCCDDCVQ